MPPGATHLISSGPIQINGDQLDSNLAAEIAQHVSNSVQRSYFFSLDHFKIKIIVFFSLI